MCLSTANPINAEDLRDVIAALKEIADQIEQSVMTRAIDSLAKKLSNSAEYVSWEYSDRWLAAHGYLFSVYLYIIWTVAFWLLHSPRYISCYITIDEQWNDVGEAWVCVTIINLIIGLGPPWPVCFSFTHQVWKNHLTLEVEWVVKNSQGLDLPQERLMMALALTLVKGVCERTPTLLRRLFATTLEYLH